MKKTTAAAAAVAVAATGVLVLGAPAAQAASCPQGGEPVVTREVVNGETAKVVKCPDVKITGAPMTGRPAPGTGGLVLRDHEGRDLGSGIGEGDRFTWSGERRKLSGGTVLVKVTQTSRGGGGWGPLYSGWVRAAYTSDPSMFSA